MGKSQRQSRKESQGWEEHPPCCGNCVHKKNPVPGVDQRFAVPGVKVAQQMKCKIGKFNTQFHSVCDLWMDKHGNELE